MIGPLGAGATSSGPTAKERSAAAIRGPRGPRGRVAQGAARTARSARAQPVCLGGTGLEGEEGALGPQGPTGAPGPPGAGPDRPGYALTTIDWTSARGADTPRSVIGADGLGLFTYYDELFGLSGRPLRERRLHAERRRRTSSIRRRPQLGDHDRYRRARPRLPTADVSRRRPCRRPLPERRLLGRQTARVSRSDDDHAGPPPPPNGHDLDHGRDRRPRSDQPITTEASSDLRGCSLREPHLLDDDDDDDRLCRRGRVMTVRSRSALTVSA